LQLDKNRHYFLAVVYVNYFQDKLLIKSVDSLIKYKVCDSLAIVVVDNSPSPRSETMETLKTICSAASVALSYTASHVNIGFGKACNHGAVTFRSKYLLFLNCDTEFIDLSLSNSIELLESSHQRVAAVGCTHLDSNLNPSFSAYPFLNDSLFNYALTSNPLLYRLYGVHKFYAIPSKPQAVGDICGAFILVNTAVFQEIRGFNPEFFLYSEDTSLCRDALANAGYTILFNPNTRILHHIGTPSAYSWRSKQVLASEMLRRYRQSLAKLLGYSAITSVNYLMLSIIALAKMDFKSTLKHLLLSFDLLLLLFVEMPVYLQSPCRRDFRVKQGL
jgi:GT2 family glycosyltransferase